MIQVENLTMGYGQLILQRDISFTIETGDIFVVLGGSGCGKTSLLRLLIGLHSPIAGSIQIEGIGTPSLAAGRPTFGVMFQSGALFGSMTLAQNVALPLEKWTDLEAEAIDVVVRSKLKLVALDGFEHFLPAEISGGMKKRAAIARALVLDPTLLFFDEPSAGLDPISAVELDDLILTLNQNLGVTMVIVTHELASIFKIGRNCIMLDRDTQSIIARGNPMKLRDKSDDPRVLNFFNRNSPRR